MLNEGDSVPDVTVQDGEGRPLRIGGARKRPLVLYFYPKDDTAGCTREAQEFSEAATDFAGAGTDILGISKDTPASHVRFVGKYGLKFPLASDTEGSATEAFGVWVEKSMYGRKYMGIERTTFLIDADGRIAKVWRKVKVPGHVDAVLEAARALSRS